MSILFSFSDVKLSLAIGSKVFAESILYVFLVEEDVYTGERCIVRSHAIVLQVLDSMHTLFRHILLSEDDSQFLRTVVTVVEEDHYVAFLDSTVYSRIVDWLDEFVCHAFVVRFLHSLNHVSSILTLAFYQEVVSFLHTFPTLVTVHGIETAHDRSDGTCALSTMSSQLFDEALTALRVSITTVHEAVDEGTFAYTIFLGDIAKLEQVVERTVYTTVGCQTHEVNVLAVFLGIAESRYHFLVLHDAVVSTSTVNLHQVLIYDATCTDVQVTYFRVTHLTVRQTYVFTACLQLRVRIVGQQTVPIRSWGIENHVFLTLSADSPAIKNH